MISNHYNKQKVIKKYFYFIKTYTKVFYEKTIIDNCNTFMILIFLHV